MSKMFESVTTDADSVSGPLQVDDRSFKWAPPSVSNRKVAALKELTNLRVV